MRKVLPFVALAAVLAGCVRSDDSKTVAGATKPAALAATERHAIATPLSAIRARVVHGERYASLPDRGELLAYTAGVPEVRTRAYTWKQVRLSEAHALDAIGGVMSVEAPDGHLVRLRYDHHIEHPNGDWTWIGRPAGAQPGTEAIITFGEKAVFGSIPDGKGPPLRLMHANGVSWMVQTDAAALASIPGAHPTGTDAIPVPRAALRPAADAPSRGSAAAPTAAAATATASTTVDLVLGYTSGFASRLGGQSQATTRLNNMVDFANQAYQNSGIDGQVRLVYTLQVDYADNTSNDQALYDLTGYDCSGSSCTRRTIPAALQPLRNARDQYGADLISLVRAFDNGTNGSCGVGWIIGGGQQPIDSSDAAWAMSIVSDSNGRGAGSFPSGGYVCRDETLAHEMGHNMGAQHDVATAKGSNGVLDANDYGRYAYSFGYKTDANNGNFYTIMAYGDSGQTAYRIFSNPRTTYCGGNPCGTNQADNAQTLAQTMPVIASFRATVVPVPVPVPVRVPVNAVQCGDANGDGRADVFWHNPNFGMEYWLMNGTTWSYGGVRGVASKYEIAAIGDFNGDSRADILWRDVDRTELWEWQAKPDGTYNVVFLRSYPAGWDIVGTGDANGDGRADVFWHNPNFGMEYWLMNGTTWSYGGVRGVASKYEIAAIGDFNGDSRADILWRDVDRTELWEWQAKPDGTYNVVFLRSYPAGWDIVGTGDANGDGRADVFWHNPNFGMEYWLMNGTTWSYGGVRGVASKYEIAAIGDFNGDSRADILWRDVDRTELWEWQAKPDGTYNVVFLRSYPAGWAICSGY
ncbi:hypothetical protein DWG18_00430 [Lysobacter sp. TY2-98]|uniref:reprolysin-like metallopeptidase n=1 Tax=Lysobacter sp. TY2-98 TaxID=2290922 RepID=UPI000E20AAC3|nr:FG-GAP-like repeat-containing protein [Lysobacter sp. TY2-98]AXK70902.1 hypothetical protein DWG18_00430 [Lysobacter sp. TY2-98]